MRHVIVEGPDGSGKDGLIARLLPLMPKFHVHERASTSVGGPVSYLTQWTEDDFATIADSGPWIYNRHPLISELIYAPVVRHEPPQGMFANPDWVDARLTELAKHAVMVWCLPPWSNVRHNVLSGDVAHMPGVAANVRPMYEAYRRASGWWPGTSLYWDYTMTKIEDLMYDLGRLL